MAKDKKKQKKGQKERGALGKRGSMTVTYEQIVRLCADATDRANRSLRTALSDRSAESVEKAVKARLDAEAIAGAGYAASAILGIDSSVVVADIASMMETV